MRTSTRVGRGYRTDCVGPIGGSARPCIKEEDNGYDDGTKTEASARRRPALHPAPASASKSSRRTVFMIMA